MSNNKSNPGGLPTAAAPAKVVNEVTVDSSFGIDAIRKLLADASVEVILFDPGIYNLSDSFPSEHIFSIKRSVTLKAKHTNKKPVLKINNTAFDPTKDNFQAGAILVEAAGGRVEFENLVINTNRSLDVMASDYLRIDGCDITTTGGPANSALFLGDYSSGPNQVTGNVIVENCHLVADPGGWTTRMADGTTLKRENFNAGLFANFTPANYQVRKNTLSGNAGVECSGVNNTLIEGNTIFCKGYINSWVSFGIVATNNQGTKVEILGNHINMDLPTPIEDPFGFAAPPTADQPGFGPGNGVGVQHGVAIQAGQLIFDLPAYDVTITDNEVSGNASFMIWAYSVDGGRIENNTRKNLTLPWFDYNFKRTPPLVPFNTMLLGMPLLADYPTDFVGMDFTEYGVMGIIIKRESWWKAFILGYVPACEYCLFHSTNVELSDNKQPVARFFDFNGTFDLTTFEVSETPSTNKILGALNKVAKPKAKTSIGSPNQAAIPPGLEKRIKIH